jgi:hypothetical protein
LKQLVQRVRLRFHVGPLDKREMREYIEHRLVIAGRKDKDLIRDDAYEVIYRYTGGVPRLINTLCDTALLCAFTEQKSVIGPADIKAAVSELNWKEHELSAGSYPERLSSAPEVQHPGHITGIMVRSEGEILAEHFFGPGRVIVGRSPDNEIYIQSKFVSRHHAQLTNDETGCTIEDLNSTNGVFIGEERIKKYRLRHGDVISLGIHELVYSDLRQARAGADPAPELKERRG